jgi:hypothetical protein
MEDSRPVPETIRPDCEPQTDRSAAQLLDRALSWARARGYSGYSKFDGLESPLLRRALGWSRFGRLLGSQLVMRSPVNLRPLLGIPRARNPKGIALFATAYLMRYETRGDPGDRREAAALLDWLCDHPSSGFPGTAWGYQHRWQDAGFYAPAGFPNRVVTSFVAEALIEGHRVLGERRYLEAAAGAARFFLEAPRVLFDDGRSRCLSYVPDPSITWRVMDVPALAARVLARLAAPLGRPDYLLEAEKLLRFVVERQTAYGAWFYADPPSASHIRHDNYHTGYILDAIRVHAEESGSAEFLPAYERGLRFYRERLFERDGAPRFMSDRPYPRDIHGAAQGIITLERAGEDPAHRALSDRILAWTVRNLWEPRQGRFFYQRCRFYTKRFTLMRWCQAWMCQALAYREARRAGFARERRLPVPAEGALRG